MASDRRPSACLAASRNTPCRRRSDSTDYGWPIPHEPLAPANAGVKRGWPDILVKLAILQDGFGGLQGPTLFLDLDVAITGPIDCFFDYKPGEFCIIHNWVHWRKAALGRRPAVGNSSV